MKLECFALDDDPLPLAPAPGTRDWMDRIPDRHAYRCLPLAIANAHGWTVGAPCDLEIVWDGGPRPVSMRIAALDGDARVARYAMSHFAFGIVTFALGWLFRTPPGWNLMATGPLNRPKDGIAPLTGIVETNWLPYPFTMNWQMTRPGRVTFDKGRILSLYRAGRLKLDELITQRYRIDEAPQAFDDLANGRNARGMIMFD